MSKSKIEWTDETWNPVTGCTKVSQGCKNCYAEREWPRMTKLVPAYAGRAFSDVRCHPERLETPLHWQKPRKVFVNSMSDLFHEDVPDEFIDQVFAVMALARQHTFQILTKRPERMREYLSSSARRDEWAKAGNSIADAMDPQRYANISHVGEPGNCVSVFSAWPLPNVWLGVSVEDQQSADERIPLLLDTPAAVRWISAEPLLGRIDLCETFGMWWNSTMQCFESTGQRFNTGVGKGGIDWVVVGGESGPNARPMHPAWVRSLRDQCATAGVPFLFKQWGEWLPDDQNPDMSPPHDPSGAIRVGKKRAGRLLDGVTHDGYPGVES